jgi:DNA processing protein
MSDICAERFEIAYGDEGYPKQLAETPDPPRVLYGLGDAGALALGLAVVGARKATPYGLAAARLLAGWAAGKGAVIVSGGAMGCDQAAHRAAVEAGGRTVAVLGCGADIDYPRSAADLLARLREGRIGCVVSELPWGAPPVKWAFARRNRIIAGLSEAVLVVEASLPSGTFSTADFALDAGRSVLVVPGSIFAPECRGSNRLLRQGATPISDVSDLAAELGWLAEVEPVVVTCGGSDPLLSALRTDPMRPDDIARSLGLSIVEIVRRIGALESKGVIARYPDGRYGPC